MTTMEMTPVEALALALALGITAPTDELATECAGMADSIAAGLSEIEVQQAKKTALAMVEAGFPE